MATTNTFQAAGFDEVMALYDALYGDFDDAISIINSDLQAKRKDADAAESKGAKDLEFLHEYITFSKMQKTIDRTLRMAQNALCAEPYKADDVARLYAIAQQILEVQEFDLLQDEPSQVKFWSGRELGFKSLRCYYLADSHIGAGQLFFVPR